MQKIFQILILISSITTNTIHYHYHLTNECSNNSVKQEIIKSLKNPKCLEFIKHTRFEEYSKGMINLCGNQDIITYNSYFCIQYSLKKGFEADLSVCRCP